MYIAFDLLKILFLTTFILVALASVVAAQPFPGYGGGPYYRFDNGAVGEVTSVGNNGRAIVDVYDGSAVTSHDVPFSRANPLPDPLTDGQIRLMAAAEGDPLRAITFGGPNLCFDASGNVSSSGSVNRVCDLVTLDICRVQQNPLRINAPCFSAQGIGATINVEVWADRNGPEDGVPTCPYSYADNAPDCEDTTTVTRAVQLPDLTEVPWPHQAGYQTMLTDWLINCVDSGSITGGCEALDPTIFDNVPEFDADAVVTGTSELPVNEPTVSPVGGDGATSNPGGYVGGGSGDDGFSAGGSSSGGGSGSSGGGTGDGNTGDGDGEETTAETSECEGCDGEFDSDTVDLPLLSFVAPGWLPAACPAPMAVDVFGSTITVMDYTFLCDFANVFKVIILIGSSMMALRIVFEGVS